MSVSKSFISTMTRELDSVVDTFLSRSLERKYPFIISDVLFIKVREDKRVVSKAFHMILGIKGLKLVISDSHSGEIKAIKDCFPRCRMAMIQSSLHEKCFS